MGMLLALALVMSYLETLIPVFIAVPGMKIGLANIVTMFVLYRYSFVHTVSFMTIRVIIAGVLFSGVFGIIYSLFGGLLCIFVMSILKKCKYVSMLGVSMTGAVFHNIGQILVAIFLLETKQIMYYFPVLCVTGLLSGLFVGFVSHLLIRRIEIIRTKST